VSVPERRTERFRPNRPSNLGTASGARLYRISALSLSWRSVGAIVSILTCWLPALPSAGVDPVEAHGHMAFRSPQQSAPRPANLRRCFLRAGGRARPDPLNPFTDSWSPPANGRLTASTDCRRFGVLGVQLHSEAPSTDRRSAQPWRAARRLGGDPASACLVPARATSWSSAPLLRSRRFKGCTSAKKNPGGRRRARVSNSKRRLEHDGVRWII